MVLLFLFAVMSSTDFVHNINLLLLGESVFVSCLYLFVVVWHKRHGEVYAFQFNVREGI